MVIKTIIEDIPLEIYSSIVDNSPLGIVIMDREGKVIRFSPGAEKIFGYKEQEIIGKSFKDFSFFSFEKLKDRLNILLTQGKIQYEVSEYPRKDQTTVTCSIAASLLKDKKGNILGSVAIIRDISEQLRQTQLFEKLNRNLITILSINEQILKDLPLEEVFIHIQKGITDMLGTSFSHIRLFNETDKTLDLVSYYSSSYNLSWQPGEMLKLPVHTNSYGGKTFVEGHPIAISDVREDPLAYWAAKRDPIPFLSVLCFPLKTKDKTLGIINLMDKNPRTFTDEEIRICTIFSSQAALAIDRAKSLQTIKEKAITDGLTGLYNHSYLHERLEEELERARAGHSPLSVLFIDLDSFKLFNDLNGHEMGDLALEEVSRIVKSCSRSIDIVARYGGEEIVAVLPETEEKDAYQVAERIRRNIAGFSFSGSSNRINSISASIGIACFPQDSYDRESLIDKADWAMYYAKRKGRNQTRIFGSEKIAYSLKGSPTLLRENLSLDTLHAMAAAVDAKDSYLGKHSEEVARVSVFLGKELNLSEKGLMKLSHAALLHDLGKIGVPDKILKKPGPLDHKEMEMVKCHPELAKNILIHVGELIDIIPIILYHHENYDGSGYPEGLRGEEIPLESRIIRIVDSYHAMISDKPFRMAYQREYIIEEFCQKKGEYYDPQIVEIFINLLNENKI